MNFVFLKESGGVAFFRSDAFRANWQQDELMLSADFPFLPDKVIQRGQRIAFRDPDVGAWQLFEVRVAKILCDGKYQGINAEHIVISELSDIHIDNGELTDVSAQAALSAVLTGTPWNVGEVTASGVSSADIQRGSVWQAVNEIKRNWNVYIEPHVTLDLSGNVGRFLDIRPAEGKWQGIRLAVDKNLDESAVTWDDSNLITAIKGYGGSDDDGDPITFADVVWTKTADHPAKAAGSEWLIDPEATALYGRNGQPRQGYYQDAAIKDPNILLEKSWESLKAGNHPVLQIEGTVTDLYRLGYADQPLRLHDTAIVEIRPAGVQEFKEIVRLNVDLINPAETRAVIGQYIPNIVYINHQTNEAATGSRGGGGGGRGKKNTENEVLEFETRIRANHQMIELEAIQRKEGEIALDSKLEITATHIQTTVENKVAGLSSAITQTATAIRSELKSTKTGLESQIVQTASSITATVNDVQRGLSSQITQLRNKISLVVKDDNTLDVASIVLGINGQTGSYVKIKANTINLDGYVTVSELSATDAKIDNLTSGTTAATSIRSTTLNASSVFIFRNTNVNWKEATISGTTIHYLGY
jgi:hypothetical protein